MTKPYNILPQAKSDLWEIWQYISEDNPGAASRVENAMYDAFDILAENPYIGRTQDGIKAKHLRFWNVYSYQIIYNPEADPLRIMRILSGYRDIVTILDDDNL